MTQKPLTVRRTDLLRISGAALLSAISPTSYARAQSLQLPVPEIDGLAVRVVVDNYQVAVVSDSIIGDVAIERFGWGLSEKPPQGTLVSEFGLSMHAQARRGNDVRNILVDFGFTPQALNNNIAMLDIEPRAIDALVLSHGHFDHFGGLTGFLQRYQTSLKPRTPLYVGGEDTFCARTWTGPPVPGNFGVIDRQALAASPITVMITHRPQNVADFAFVTGPIPLTSFEKVLSPSSMHIGMKNGNGCNPESFSAAERAQGTIPDHFGHEIATVFNLKGKGLVVLTSCSHRGVLNTIDYARTASGIQKVHAVIGGFHLVPFKEDYVSETVAGLKELDVDYVIPLHCTGDTFFAIAKNEIPSRLLRSYTGTRFVFTA